MKKIISLAIAVITVISAAVIPVCAASPSDIVNVIKSNLPIVTSASPSSGAAKAYAYSDSSLSTKQTSYYIDTYVDKIVITDISRDGRAVYVKYPTSGGNFRTKWFRTDDILGLSSIYIREFTSDAKYNVYRKSSAAGTKTNGTIYKGDRCTILGEHKVGTGFCYVTLYPVSSSTVNGISGVKHKIALSAIPVSSQNSGNTSANNNSSALISHLNTSGIVSEQEIMSAASKYGITSGSNACKALRSINSKYEGKFTQNEKKGTLIFMFEGVGSSSSSAKRMNAMFVVVQNGKITYINRNSSTIPDYPFDPSKNDYTDMPTLKSGIYSFTTVNHNSSYAALKVTNAAVVRFKNKNSYYSSTSTGINVHRRSSDSIADKNASWVNSAGCLLVGRSGKSTSSEYAEFIKVLGIAGPNPTGTGKYTSKLTGKIVVDRSYAYNYLINVGYPSSAINSIG